MLETLAFIDLFLMALITGVSFSHLLQRGPKSELPGPQFLAVQQILLRNYGAVIGALEVTAFLLAVLLAMLVRARPALFYLAAGAAVCLALMIAIWAVWINGINKTEKKIVKEILVARRQEEGEATELGLSIPCLLGDSLTTCMFAPQSYYERILI
jgi:hypothetical protein